MKIKQTTMLSKSILVGTYDSGRVPFRQFNSGIFGSAVNDERFCVLFY